MSDFSHELADRRGQPSPYSEPLIVPSLVGATALQGQPQRIAFPPVPPHLSNRMKEYHIELPPFAPVFDRCFVYPVQDADMPEKTDGGIYLAESTRQKLGAQRGVLIAAGPKAVEVLYSHGIVLGDILITARLSPWERLYSTSTTAPDGTVSGRLHRVLILRAEDVVGSEDLRTKYDTGELRLEMDESGHVQLHDRERIDPKQNGEGM